MESMNKRMIKIKVSRQRMEALYGLYDWMIGQYMPGPAHEHLLYAHLVAMYWRIEAMLLKDWEKATLKVNECEALAFCQLWGGATELNQPGREYALVIVAGIIEQIDRVQKTNRVKAITHNV